MVRVYTEMHVRLLLMLLLCSLLPKTAESGRNTMC